MMFCLWPIEQNLDEFLIRLNNLVDTISFTVEIENNKALSFLDVKVERDDFSHFKFNIFRKPTSNNSFIHFYSGHNKKVKESVFLSMFLRARRICSPEFYDDEINTIYNIGNTLKYPRIFLKKCENIARSIFIN